MLKAPLPARDFNVRIATLFRLSEPCRKAELSMNGMGGSTNIHIEGRHIYSDEDIGME
jgi:hypothetical protein